MTLYKYKYMGDAPLVLIDQHKEVEKNGDVIELDEPIDNVFFVLIPEESTQENTLEVVTESKKKSKEGANQ